MKKIIGILGVAVIAATMFFSANNVNGSSSDTSLASLMSMNVASAQTESSTTQRYETQVCALNGVVWSACSKPDNNGPCDRKKSC